MHIGLKLPVVITKRPPGNRRLFCRDKINGIFIGEILFVRKPQKETSFFLAAEKKRSRPKGKESRNIDTDNAGACRSRPGIGNQNADQKTKDG